MVVIGHMSVSMVDVEPPAFRVGGHIGTGSAGAVVACDDYGANSTPFC